MQVAHTFSTPVGAVDLVMPDAVNARIAAWVRAGAQTPGDEPNTAVSGGWQSPRDGHILNTLAPELNAALNKAVANTPSSHQPRC